MASCPPGQHDPSPKEEKEIKDGLAAVAAARRVWAASENRRHRFDFSTSSPPSHGPGPGGLSRAAANPDFVRAVQLLAANEPGVWTASFVNMGIRDEDVARLASALALNTIVRSCYLSLNSIGDAGARQLADALSRNRSLRKLDISCAFGGAGPTSLPPPSVHRHQSLDDASLAAGISAPSSLPSHPPLPLCIPARQRNRGRGSARHRGGRRPVACAWAGVHERCAGGGGRGVGSSARSRDDRMRLLPGGTRNRLQSYGRLFQSQGLWAEAPSKKTGQPASQA